ncbi:MULTISPECIES: hypothetical protein [Vibrio]|nr:MULTISPECIES: hypothetical protein [Vibrio]EGQ9231690.1 hypothetical protein [Vibrio alginolyticus]EGR0800544.1 hypothetical protein [Vibrio alginolyticus]EIP0121520.1 hypothetical protein [Vibrio alginolyticus]ELE6600260.1 hypothetical protein [Vibrio alginolyticus]EMC2459628.1 hypothetical protein [Vibrio alginolyticus]
MTKRVIMLEQFINSATRSEPAGTTTVGALTNISDTQLADNPVLYVEHADGGLNVYLSQIVAQAQKDIDAESITSGTLNTGRLPVIPVEKVPSASAAKDSGSGWGGVRYSISGSDFTLIVG